MIRFLASRSRPLLVSCSSLFVPNQLHRAIRYVQTCHRPASVGLGTCSFLWVWSLMADRNVVTSSLEHAKGKGLHTAVQYIHFGASPYMISFTSMLLIQPVLLLSFDHAYILFSPRARHFPSAIYILFCFFLPSFLVLHFHHAFSSHYWPCGRALRLCIPSSTLQLPNHSSSQSVDGTRTGNSV